MSHELSFDTVIPSAILLNENIELTAVKLYAFIKGLTKLHGYCFATNEYLASLMKSDGRSIQRWLKSLVSEGYLAIETKKNGMHWQRLIYLSDKFKKCLRRDFCVTPPRHVCHPPTTPVSPILEDKLNEDNKREREAQAPPAPSFSVIGRVKMTTDKLAKLYAEFGQEKIKEMIERLEEYADINPKRFKQYADHATVIRKWIRDDSSKGPKSLILKDKIYAEEICLKLKHPEIQMDTKAIEFVKGQYCKRIEFGTPGFQEQVKNQLFKMGLYDPTHG